MSVTIIPIPNERPRISRPHINANFLEIKKQVELLQNGGGPGGAYTPLSRLSQSKQKTVPPFVQHALPNPGETMELANLSGAGVLKKVWITIESGDYAWNTRLRIRVDGELTAGFDCDLGTLFLTHLNAHTDQGGSKATLHMVSAPYGSGRPGAMSGGMLFPVPFSNGCIVELFAPLGTTGTSSDNALYTQIDYEQGNSSPLRLRSNCRPYLRKKTYLASDVITFFDMPNAAGTLVWQSVAVKGTTNETYLERIWFWGVDGEDVTPDGNGVVTTDFSCSGGEDLFLSGWYFVGEDQIQGQPWTILQANGAGNADFVTVVGYDFLAANGGLKFDSELKCGWSRKPGGYLTTGHDQSWCFLYYIDTSVPFAPSAPLEMAATPGSGQLIFSWEAPASLGSSPITSYVVTFQGAEYTVGAGTFSYTFTGLTNGDDYSATVRAVNAVGEGAESDTADGTPAAGVPTIPTITTATILSQFMANSLTASDGDLIAAWAKNTGSSSVSYAQATGANKPTYKTALANGLPGLRFAAAGPNMMGPSGSYNTAAPCGVIAAVKPVATLNQRLWDTNMGGGSHGRALGGINSSSKWSTYAGTGDAIGATATSAFHVVAWIQNGASSYVSTDGTKGTLANAGSGGIDTMLLGADALSSPSSTFDGDLLELIVFSGDISDSDRHLLEAYLGTKYGITVA